MAEIHAMKSGDGPKSYAKNSKYQREMIDAAKELVREAIEEKLDLGNPSFHPSKPFRIADLGCATGPNAFIAVQNVVDAVAAKYHSGESPEFQVFFSDRVDNDFNTLFRALPQGHKYFAAGVPGSFHGRLFPAASLEFVHSSFSLHWLSKVPSEVIDRDSPAWNKGRIHCTGVEKEVAKAYLGQFKKDMDIFLRARAQELVDGGLLVLVVPGVPNGVLHGHTRPGFFFDLLGTCLSDMANMGLTSQELVDSFNLPLYFPSVEVLQDIILKTNDYFTLEKIDVLTQPTNGPAQPTNSASHTTAQTISKNLRVTVEATVKEQFGVEIVEPLFDTIFPKKIGESYSILEKSNASTVDLFVLLKRKIN